MSISADIAKGKEVTFQKIASSKRKKKQNQKKKRTKGTEAPAGLTSAGKEKREDLPSQPKAEPGALIPIQKVSLRTEIQRVQHKKTIQQKMSNPTNQGG